MTGPGGGRALRVLRTLPAVALLGALAGCSVLDAGTGDGADPEATAPAPSSSAAADGISAESMLAALATAPERAGEPYDRRAFGYENGFDPDGDGCYTWREVLIRDSLTPVSIGRSCAVRGTWRSVYDDRLTTDPRDLSIDHLVPLAEAWRSGAWRWDADRLVAYGNDLDFRPALQAVTAAVNEDKASDDPARWLPAEDRCRYAEQWIEVKTRWGLTVDAAERAALQRVLDGCAPAVLASPPQPDVARLSGTG